MNTSQTVAFIGLGAMGYPMAGHLSQAGHRVAIYNRTAATAQAWCQQHMGHQADTPRAAATGADFVMMCVGNDDDVRSVFFGEHGVLAGCASTTIVIDHTTTSAELARELHAACLSKGVGFLDAPVSGGQAGAENGALTIMLGGEEGVFQQALSVLESYAKKIQLMGSVGAGQQTKMVNQICIAGILQGLSEGLNFAERSGLDISEVVDVICQGAAQSWQMDNRHTTMAAGEFDFGFAVDWMRKDLGIALRAGDAVGAPLPLTALVDQFYGDIQRLEGGRWDTSSLIQRLRARPGAMTRQD